MYFLTGNENERKKEMNELKRVIHSNMNARKYCLDCLQKYPKNAVYWQRSIKSWNNILFHNRRDLAKLIARVNRYTYRNLESV